MKAMDIVIAFKVSPSLVSRILKGDRTTRDKDLAIQIACLSGRKPITYIKPELRETYLKAYPELGEKIKKSA